MKNMTYKIQKIGTIHSPYKTKEVCPIQGFLRPYGRGTVEILPEYKAALETIETFSHIILIYIFDRAGEIILTRPTFLDDANHGVFARSGPCLPNGIGMSIVKLENRDENELEISGIDVLDNTPLIDIKPYIPKFDHREEANNGWVEAKEYREKPENRE